jgi:hypothetical protein
LERYACKCNKSAHLQAVALASHNVTLLHGAIQLGLQVSDRSGAGLLLLCVSGRLLGQCGHSGVALGVAGRHLEQQYAAAVRIWVEMVWVRASGHLCGVWCALAEAQMRQGL